MLVDPSAYYRPTLSPLFTSSVPPSSSHVSESQLVRPRICPRILPGGCRLAMDSVPQELIDAIIGNVPQSSLPSCSLVAKRWRRESQRRVLATILFSSEREIKRWCTDIPQDSGGISSYVRHVKIKYINSWTEPALFSQMLGSLSSLTTLSVTAAKIPDEFSGHILRGELGKRITTLNLWLTYCRLPTLTSMILSLPNLKELRVDHCKAMPEGPLPTYPVTPERGPLDMLELLGHVDGIEEALAEFRLTSRHLSLDIGMKNIERLLLLSSETLVELSLCGAWSLWILRPSRDDNDRSYRYSNQWVFSSHPPTAVACPYHPGYRPSFVLPLASPYKHPAVFHRLNSSVVIYRYKIYRLGTHGRPLSGGSVG